MSTRKCGMCDWRNAPMLQALDDQEEVKEYDKYAVGLYKKVTLVGHIPIEISNLCFHFINQDPGNKIKA